jgi:hypothetical protein
MRIATLPQRLFFQFYKCGSSNLKYRLFELITKKLSLKYSTLRKSSLLMIFLII